MDIFYSVAGRLVGNRVPISLLQRFCFSTYKLSVTVFSGTVQSRIGHSRESRFYLYVLILTCRHSFSIMLVTNISQTQFTVDSPKQLNSFVGHNLKHRMEWTGRFGTWNGTLT